MDRVDDGKEPFFAERRKNFRAFARGKLCLAKWPQPVKKYAYRTEMTAFDKVVDLIAGGMSDGFTAEAIHACASKIRLHTRA